MDIRVVVMTRRKIMVSALALGWCVLFTPVQSRAQNGKAAQKFEQLATQLQLTPDQKRQLIPILVAEAPKVQAIKNDASLTRMQKLENLKQLHDETDPQVKAI